MNDALEILNTLIQLDQLDHAPEQSRMPEKVEALRRRLPPPILAYYSRCRTQGRKPVVMMSGDGLCRGCSLRASRGVLVALQRGRDIQVCEHCGSYLLWETASLNAPAVTQRVC